MCRPFPEMAAGKACKRRDGVLKFRSYLKYLVGPETGGSLHSRSWRAFSKAIKLAIKIYSINSTCLVTESTIYLHVLVNITPNVLPGSVAGGCSGCSVIGGSGGCRPLPLEVPFQVLPLAELSFSATKQA